MESIVIGFATCSSEQEARHIARTLVEEKLCACVNIVPKVVSVYSWEDSLQEDDEVLMIIKTSSGNAQSVISKVQELHTYALPEIIFTPIIAGSDNYINWVANSVK